MVSRDWFSDAVIRLVIFTLHFIIHSLWRKRVGKPGYKSCWVADKFHEQLTEYFESVSTLIIFTSCKTITTDNPKFWWDLVAFAVL
jgi:hypothetical protein